MKMGIRDFQKLTNWGEQLRSRTWTKCSDQLNDVTSLSPARYITTGQPTPVISNLPDILCSTATSKTTPTGTGNTMGLLHFLPLCMLVLKLSRAIELSDYELVLGDSSLDKRDAPGSAGPPRRPTAFKSLQEAQNYLTALQDYYSVVSRPRFGRAGGMKAHGPPIRPKTFNSVQEAQNYISELRDYYAVMGRPRFGRSAPAHH